MESLTVTLKISRHFRGALLLHIDHIEAHLLFGDNYCECHIPYEAVWGTTSESGETTSWLEGFDEQSRPETAGATLEEEGEEEASVHIDSAPDTESFLVSGLLSSRPDKKSKTPAQFKLVGAIDNTEPEKSTLEDADFQSPKEKDPLAPEKPLLVDNKSGDEKLEQEIQQHVEPPVVETRTEETKTASFPPLLQSVSKTPSDQALSENKETTSEKKSSHRPGTASRPKLVRVK